jgi:hypothetical protein
MLRIDAKDLIKFHGTKVETRGTSKLSDTSQIWSGNSFMLLLTLVLPICTQHSEAAVLSHHGANSFNHRKLLYEPDVVDSDGFTSELSSTASRSISSEFSDHESSSFIPTCDHPHPILPKENLSAEPDQMFDFGRFSATRCDLGALIGREDHSHHIDWLQVTTRQISLTSYCPPCCFLPHR